MIKTHKPHGHIWSCSGRFQQQKGYRDVRYEDYTPPGAAALVPDSDDDLPEIQRAAKRRRIEKLAGNFFDGKVPPIASAAQVRRYTKPCEKRAVPTTEVDVEAATSPRVEQATWLDVDDDWEAVRKILARRKNARASPARPCKAAAMKSGPRDSSAEHSRPASEMPPVRRTPVLMRSSRHPIAPSTDAVSHAAALKARAAERTVARKQPTTLEIEREAGKVRSRVTRSKSEGITFETETAHSACKQRRHVLASPKRRAQREYHPRTPQPTPSGIFGETTLDPLQQDSPGHRPQRFEPGNTVSETPSFDQSHESTFPETDNTSFVHEPAVTPMRYEPLQGNSELGQAQAEPVLTKVHNEEAVGTSNADASERSHSQALAFYHTAPEAIEADWNGLRSDPEPRLQERPPVDQDDSQTALLLRNGVDASSRQSFASVNTKTPILDMPLRPVSPRAPGRDTRNSIKEAVQQSARQHGGQKRSRRASIRKPTRRRTDPDQSKTMSADGQTLGGNAGEVLKKVYLSAQMENEDSPFLFRHKGTVTVPQPDNAPVIIVATKKSRRRVTYPSSDKAAVVQKADAEEWQPPAVSEKAPTIDVPLGQDSSFGINLNMAIVSDKTSVLIRKCTNSILPSEHGRRRSSKVMELRQAMRDAGADIEKSPDEPISSQVSGGTSMGARNDTAAPEAKGVPEWLASTRKSAAAAMQSQVFASTQAMLREAEKGLIESPEKSATNLTAGHESTPEGWHNSMQHITPFAEFHAKMNRQPLGPLSQPLREHLPSTQAMLADFSGFSTVKKPGWGKRASFAPTPTKGNHESEDESLDMFAHSFASEQRAPTSTLRGCGSSDGKDHAQGAIKRKSSLRFSLSQPNDAVNYLTGSAYMPWTQPSAQTPVKNPSATPKLPSYGPQLGHLTDDNRHTASSAMALTSLPSQPVPGSTSFDQTSEWSKLPCDSQRPSAQAGQREFDHMRDTVDRPASSGTQHDMDDVTRSLLGSQPFNVEHEMMKLGTMAR